MKSRTRRVPPIIPIINAEDTAIAICNAYQARAEKPCPASVDAIRAALEAAATEDVSVIIRNLAQTRLLKHLATEYLLTPSLRSDRQAIVCVQAAFEMGMAFYKHHAAAAEQLLTAVQEVVHPDINMSDPAGEQAQAMQAIAGDLAEMPTIEAELTVVAIYPEGRVEIPRIASYDAQGIELTDKLNGRTAGAYLFSVMTDNLGAEADPAGDDDCPCMNCRLRRAIVGPRADGPEQETYGMKNNLDDLGELSSMTLADVFRRMGVPLEGDPMTAPARPGEAVN